MSGGGGKKEADRLVRDLRKFFRWTDSRYSVEKVSGGHWAILAPSGGRVMTFPSTPSDVRFRHNAVARLRQKGVVPREFR